MTIADRDRMYLHHLIGRSDWHASLGAHAIPEAGEGFVHLSTIDQVRDTAARYYAERDDLLLLSISTSAIESSLKWEESHPGQWFPHAYSTVPIASVVSVVPFPRPFGCPTAVGALGQSTGVRLADPARDAAAVPALGDVADGRRGACPVAEVAPDRVDRYRALLADPSGLSIVYEEEAELMAAIVGIPQRASFGRGDVVPGSMHVSSVATRPDAWGRGLASLLLHHYDTALVEAGFHHAELWAHDDNERAQRVYERHGYRRTNAPHAYDAMGSTIFQYELTIQS